MEGPKCCLTSAPISSVRPWPSAAQAKEKGDSVSPHLLLQNPGSFCLLKLFQFLKFWAKLWWQTVFPWLTQRGNVHSYTLPVCAGHHSFLWARSSTAMNQALRYSAGGTPKLRVVPIAIISRTLCATGSNLDMAQWEQLQAVYSMDEKTLLYALLSKQEASEKPQSKMSLKQLKLDNNWKNARVATSSNYTLLT